MFGSTEAAICDSPIVDLIAKAATEVGCINIRAMIKAWPFIEMMASSAAMDDATWAGSSRAGALVEAVGFAIRCASGYSPAKPEGPNGKTMDAEWLSNAKEEAALGHYSSTQLYLSTSARAGVRRKHLSMSLLLVL